MLNKWFENNWPQLVVSCFLSVFCVMIAFSFDVINIWLGLAGALVGTFLGALLGEGRRFDTKVPGWWIAYVIAFLVGGAFAIYACSLQ